MSSLEIELHDLREKNNDLVKKVQYWKMTAAQRENEKLDLMKENNDLRLKLSRLRSGGAAHARQLDTEIQSASKEALSHLVQASSAVTRTVQLAKAYMQERQELETMLPRWSSVSCTPSTEKVHRVMPMLIGGQSIQPVVSLSRTMVNVNNIRSNRSPNNSQSHNFSERGALPMHMLQDLYIPLTRIDANGLPVNNMDVDPEVENGSINNSTDDLGLDDSGNQSHHESSNVSDTDQFSDTRILDVVEEDVEPAEEVQPLPKNKPRGENPLEGPSWLMDGPNKNSTTKSRMNLEPDSTTEFDELRGSLHVRPGPSRHQTDTERDRLPLAVALACEFSPTVRRRKRPSSPPAASRSPLLPRPASRRNSNNGRILKVLVSKLRLEEDDVSPPKRSTLANSPSRPDPSSARRESTDSSLRRPTREESPMTSQTARARDRSPSLRLSRDVQLSFDAPSPNGATSHVVISETMDPMDAGGSGEPAKGARKINKHDNRSSRDSKHDGHNSCEPKHDVRNSNESKQDSRGSHDSDSGSDVPPEGRTRRPRKAVTYKEKPLNRKMRR